MYKFTGTLFLIFFTGLLGAQEICNNGIDDDGNGLIDLNDTSQCNCSFNLPSLIPNPSFEDKVCCPGSFGKLSCAKSWTQASNATSDYFNLCGLSDAGFPFSKVPIPLSGGGSAWGGFINGYHGGIGADWKEYLGACLLGTMSAGTSYTIDFDLAYGGGPSTLEVVIYGTTNCSNLPINTTGCPLTSPTGGWVELGAQTLVLTAGSWQTGSITFTPLVDIKAIAIGPNCVKTSSAKNYYFIDNLILNLTKEVQIGVVESGSFCDHDIVLNATADSIGGTWQWYFGGVALVGETADSVEISVNNYGPGKYTVNYLFKGDCYSKEYELLDSLTSNFIDVQVACSSYTWIDGKNYTASNNTARDTIPGGAANGCDSIVKLDLTINYPTNSIDAQVACGSYTWIDGINYTTSNNTATDTIPGGAASGCDSIITLDLTINYPANSIDVQIACGSYTWIDGINYTTSNNTATDTIPGGAANGCDSIVNLDLTINNVVNSIDVQVACGSYTWIDGINYTMSNNTAIDTIFGGASNGCDSIVTLDLTINYPVNSIDVQVACGSYTWMDGKNYTMSNNTAIDTIFGGTSNGCDSIVTLNLTIINPVNSIDVQIACGSYNWIDGNTYTSSNNTTIDTIFGGAANGCDSIIKLDLTIHPEPVINLGEDAILCNNSILLTPGIGFVSYSWNDGSTDSTLLIDAAGKYDVTVFDENGCDGFDAINIIDDCPFSLWVPNTFTPGGDHLNNVFKVVSENIVDMEVTIFNRWGEIIQSWKSIKGSWDGMVSGKMAQDGVYVYTINYSYYNKEILIREKKIGHVNLLK